MADLAQQSLLPSCEEDLLLSSPCEVRETNRYVTQNIGLDITSWRNPTSTTTVSASIPDGYYQGKSVQLTEATLTAANIISGVNIFGVTGTYVCSGNSFAENISSMMHRDLGETPLTLHSESVTSASTAYVNDQPGYRVIPKYNLDTEGESGINVTLVDRTGWGATTCGTSGTIENRISDCATVFAANATWDGATKGHAGQGVWKLVARIANLNTGRGREVWRDERTQLLWSSKLSTNIRWCKASGANFITGNPASENDPDDLCDNATYQNVNPATSAVSACFEDGTNFLPTDGSIDNNGKAGLNRTSSPSVFWRLPTKWDYHLAEMNGIRFVLPDMAATNGTYEWTATLFNVSLYAWSFYGATGNIQTSDRTSTNRSVRCVGR